MTRTTRQRWGALVATATLVLTVIPAAQASPAVPTSGPSATSYCGITWGSLAKRTTVSHSPGTVAGVRAGRHACYDRLVIDVAKVPRSLSYDVRYVTQVRQPGSGAVVGLTGGARLQIELRAPAYDNSGRATYRPADRSRLVDVTGWRTFRQVAVAGSFEGQTTLGLGVRARLPFRVMVLDGPGEGARLVVDVAHRW